MYYRGLVREAVMMQEAAEEIDPDADYPLPKKVVKKKTKKVFPKSRSNVAVINSKVLEVDQAVNWQGY